MKGDTLSDYQIILIRSFVIHDPRRRLHILSLRRFRRSARIWHGPVNEVVREDFARLWLADKTGLDHPRPPFPDEQRDAVAYGGASHVPVEEVPAIGRNREELPGDGLQVEVGAEGTRNVTVGVRTSQRSNACFQVGLGQPREQGDEGVWDTEVRPGAQCSQGQALSSTEIA